MPAAVVAEMILLQQLGRIVVGLPEVRSLVEQGSLSFLPLDLDQFDLFGSPATFAGTLATGDVEVR